MRHASALAFFVLPGILAADLAAQAGTQCGIWVLRVDIRAAEERRVDSEILQDPSGFQQAFGLTPPGVLWSLGAMAAGRPGLLDPHPAGHVRWETGAWFLVAYGEAAIELASRPSGGAVSGAHVVSTSALSIASDATEARGSQGEAHPGSPVSTKAGNVETMFVNGRSDCTPMNRISRFATRATGRMELSGSGAMAVDHRHHARSTTTGLDATAEAHAHIQAGPLMAGQVSSGGVTVTVGPLAFQTAGVNRTVFQPTTALPVPWAAEIDTSTGWHPGTGDELAGDPSFRFSAVAMTAEGLATRGSLVTTDSSATATMLGRCTTHGRMIRVDISVRPPGFRAGAITSSMLPLPIELDGHSPFHF